MSSEEGAGVVGASARSLSWLLLPGVVRLVPVVAVGTSSLAGDPISSFCSVAGSRSLGRPPPPRDAS